MKARNRVPNLDHIGRKRPRSLVRELPPEEAWMTPGGSEDPVSGRTFQSIVEEFHRNSERTAGGLAVTHSR